MSQSCRCRSCQELNLEPVMRGVLAIFYLLFSIEKEQEQEHQQGTRRYEPSLG